MLFCFDIVSSFASARHPATTKQHPGARCRNGDGHAEREQRFSTFYRSSSHFRQRGSSKCILSPRLWALSKEENDEASVSKGRYDRLQQANTHKSMSRNQSEHTPPLLLRVMSAVDPPTHTHTHYTPHQDHVRGQLLPANPYSEAKHVTSFREFVFLWQASSNRSSGVRQAETPVSQALPQHAALLLNLDLMEIF